MNIICERCHNNNCSAVPYSVECDAQYYPYLMVLKHPNDKYPREFECKDMNDLESTYNIWFDDDCEVEFYDATHQIFPEWAQ